MSAARRALPILALALAASSAAQGMSRPPATDGDASTAPTVLFAYFDGTNVVTERSRGTAPCEATGPGTSCQFVPGQYEIMFDRNVSACAYSATSALNRFRTLTALPRGGKANAVFVTAFNEHGAMVATPFYLTVNC